MGPGIREHSMANIVTRSAKKKQIMMSKYAIDQYSIDLNTNVSLGRRGTRRIQVPSMFLADCELQFKDESESLL